MDHQSDGQQVKMLTEWENINIYNFLVLFSHGGGAELTYATVLLGVGILDEVKPPAKGLMLIAPLC